MQKTKLFTRLREDDILAVLHAADAIDRGRIVMRCPAHHGGAASTLEVHLAAGRYELRCAYGCTAEEVVQAALDALRNKCETCDSAVIARAMRVARS